MVVSGSVCVSHATQNAGGEGGIYIYIDIYQWNVRRRYLCSRSTERERERETRERDMRERERERESFFSIAIAACASVGYADTYILV